MRISYFIISVLFLYNFGNTYCIKICKDSSDCVAITSCPEAARLNRYRKTNGTINYKFILSVCGATIVDNNLVPQVCCSDFEVEKAVPSPQPTIDQRIAFGVSASLISDDNDFTNHDNIELLPNVCGKYFEDRIIGGEFAHLYEFPWMALISYSVGTGVDKKLSFDCGGSIITSKYILTAAHCLKPCCGKVMSGVRIGEYDLRGVNDCEGQYNVICENHLQDMAIEKPIIHKDYLPPPKLVNDIALIRVKGEIDFSFRNVAPICLPVFKEHHESRLTEQKVVVAGWGITETGRNSMVLKKVTIRVLSEPAPTDDRQIITAGNAGRDSCNGDSGGPMMQLGEYNHTERIIQYGLVSFGPTQCGSSSPGGYTDVRKYMRWILDNIEE